MTATAISTAAPASPGCGRPSSRHRSNSLSLVSFRQHLQHTRQKHEPRNMDGSMIPTKLSKSVAFCWQIAPHTGGGGGMPTRPDLPQSVQSVPRAHMLNSLPGPPSSQSRSSAVRHMLEHVGVPPGFSDGGDSDGWADTESASNRKESIHSINLLIDLLAWTDACARLRHRNGVSDMATPIATPSKFRTLPDSMNTRVWAMKGVTRSPTDLGTLELLCFTGKVFIFTVGATAD